ncbi:DUF1275 family protein [Pseudonocardia endophytica]|uniref:Uncharacterized protein DUF1275 n=1 Tax=Pseudonocardia endophytica TaxID=401976 RepID=A0A4R1HKQ9_PSEEN|nr:DUF1275 family protein [Pseudonocardia endophytica]TCK21563.1 uncharacterized protein DUF1275 [Pseudonocardia endophytica]
MTSSRSTAIVLALMAACAGVVDLWAVTSLGGAFAGVVTGNLVTVGRALGLLDVRDLVAPAVAVVGFAVGVGVWSFARRRRAPVLVLLASELVLLVALAVAWPLDAPAPVLLAVASIAMGGQSSIALDLGESTTYLTGTLTGAVAALVVDGRGRWSAVRQLGALVLGATTAAALLGTVPWAVPLLAAVPLAAAVLVRVLGEKRQDHQERDGDDRGTGDGTEEGPEEGEALRT